MVSHEFDPDEVGTACQWFVDRFLPLGDYILCGGNPRNGKSFLVEQLIADVICGESFLDMPTVGGDVLLFDEDNCDAAKVQGRIKRLLRGRTPKFKLFTCIGQGLRIIDGNASQFKAVINQPEHMNVVLVVIESLAAVAGAQTDMDGTRGSSRLVDGIRSLTRPDRALILTHHISIHNPVTIEGLMNIDNPETLIMNGTRIVSASSALWVIASKTKKTAGKNGEISEKLDEIYVRTRSRRDVLRDSFRVGVRDIGEFMLLYVMPNEAPELTVWQEGLLSHFPLDQMITIKELFELTDQFLSPVSLYKERDRLVEAGYIKLEKKRGEAGSHYFSLTELGREWYYANHDFADGGQTNPKINFEDMFSTRKNNNTKSEEKKKEE